MTNRSIKLYNRYICSGVKYQTEVERVRALHVAITIQAIKDIETPKKRCVYWRSVWRSLTELAPVYHMTRGEFVICLASTGTIKMSPEEMEQRKVAVTEVEKAMLERYKDEYTRKAL